jgi:S-adenosylmethionine:tRNA ribosyltransferase-isomerase
LLVLHRSSGKLEHRAFLDLPEYLNPGDGLVINQTKVIPARLRAEKIPGGGKIELLLLRQVDPQTWEVLVGGKGIRPGKEVRIQAGPKARIERDLGGPRRLVHFTEPLTPSFLEAQGEMPLPPYIKTPLQDPQEYQTTFAKIPGSAAAPTAGLHFTPRVLSMLENRGVSVLRTTLHVGLDTFAPVNEDDPRSHAIHSEWCSITEDSAAKINQIKASGGRILAVGTTSVRVLESAAAEHPDGHASAFEGRTDLFILPGYSFKLVDAMLTNFHLPRSTLIMMVSAFADRKMILDAYQEAMHREYRFYSFGDAMLIL